MELKAEFWEGKRVFVTGHTGFKGSWLSLWLQSLGAEVTGYSLAPPTFPNLFTVAGVATDMNSLIADIRDLNKSFGKDSVHTAIYFKSSEVGTWKNPGNDLFNMNIKPFGFRLSDSKEWYSGSKIYFACQSDDTNKFAIIVLTEFNDDIFINEKEIETENYGLYVRCIKQ